MAFASIGSAAVAEARVAIPRVGVWTASVALDEDAELSGRLDLQLGGALFRGFARRYGASEGQGMLQMVGGAGGLRAEVEPRGYRNVALSLPLRDILTAAGERLSPSSSSEVLTSQLAHWATVRGTAGSALVHLCTQVGASWRVLPDGSVWVGFEGWPTNDVTHELITEEPLFDRLTISSEAAELQPGQTFRGRHVSYVLHVLEDDDFTTTVWFE